MPRPKIIARQVGVGQLRGDSHLASTQTARIQCSGLGMALGVNSQRQVGDDQPQGDSHLASIQTVRIQCSGLGMALGVNSQRQVGANPSKWDETTSQRFAPLERHS